MLWGKPGAAWAARNREVGVLAEPGGSAPRGPRPTSRPPAPPPSHRHLASSRDAGTRLRPPPRPREAHDRLQVLGRSGRSSAAVAAVAAFRTDSRRHVRKPAVRHRVE